MEKIYRDAIFTGLKCGAIIAGLYLICVLVVLCLSSTPAMVSYINYILMHPYATSYPDQLPMEFYFVIVLNVVVYAVIFIGLLATGVYALRSGEQRKNTVNYIVTIGAIAGIAAVIPLFFANIIFEIFAAAIGYPLSSFSLGSPYNQGRTVSTLGVTLCTGMALFIIISAIVSAAGAWGYAYFTKGIKSAF